MMPGALNLKYLDKDSYATPYFFGFIKCQIYTSFYFFTYSEPIFFL